MLGQTLGHYRVLEQIGAGGMGVVYRAHDERLDRDVALKVLPASTLVDEAARKRFRQEALTLSKLNHPNIETVFDFDTQDGVDFLVMELIPGVTLDQKLVSGALPEKDLLRLGQQLAEGLAAAHEQGIIHRDLKPGNLRVTPDGRLKILDFGLAKLLQPVTHADVTQSVTETQSVTGTLPYMAPEQLRGETADARSDIWAAGAVLYEMATGRRPFDAKLSTALAGDIQHTPPPSPRQLKFELSPKLEDIILKCLEKEPDNRYQSARELAVDLRRLAAPAATAVVAVGLPAKKRWKTFAAVSVAGLVVLIAAVSIANLGGVRDRLLGKAAAPQIKSIAVLPLANLSGDPEQEYFADGMTEALITDLAQISALRVISRTSVMEYKGAKKPLPQIARELNVDAVVEGSVQRSGGRVRISAQLIEAQTDRHLWARSYERQLSDVLTLQEELARSIAGEIRVKLTPQEQARLASARAVNPDAHEAYLLGRFHLEKGDPAGLEKALAYFQQAVQKDPQYAPAYTGLADYYGILPFYTRSSPSEVFPKAQAAALRALEIDSNLAEAHASLAYTLAYYDWDWAGAEREFQRALALNPNYSAAHARYSRLLGMLGRLDEARAQMQRVQELEPLSLSPRGNLAMLAYFAGQYDVAIVQLQEILEMDPKFPTGYWGLGLAYEQKGQYKQAIAAFERAQSLAPGSLNIKASLGHAYAVQGDVGKAKQIIAELKDQSRQKYVSSYQVALVFAGLGQKKEALDWLERAYNERSTPVAYARMDPRLASLRSDARFQDLLRRMKFPP
ncbi:MAG TPA: protein kinase [Terriglobales bacterium]|nr:protein kinase [Terriglobales bacterium]